MPRVVRRLGAKKVGLAISACDIIDAQVQRLDGDLARLEGEPGRAAVPPSEGRARRASLAWQHRRAPGGAAFAAIAPGDGEATSVTPDATPDAPAALGALGGVDAPVPFAEVDGSSAAAARRPRLRCRAAARRRARAVVTSREAAAARVARRD